MLTQLLYYGVFFACLFWWAMYVKIAYSIYRIKNLTWSPLPQAWPTLSVIIPACNEADTIRPALERWLQQDYPNLTLYVVNDRSSDATGQIVDELARTAPAHGPQIRPIHINNLPDGWLGKVHALHTALAHVGSDWVLFTDADVHFEPQTLRKTIAYCRQEQLDHLAMMPYMIADGFWLTVAITAFGAFFLEGVRVHAADNPKSTAYAGVGAFNLIKKAAFDRTPGLDWLKMEIVDDVGVGLLMKQAGARSRFVLGLDDATINWYPTLTAMMKGLEKNTFGAATRYRFDFFLLLIIVYSLLLTGPFVAFFLPFPFWLLGLLTFGLMSLAGIFVARKTRRPFLSFICFPIGQAIMGLILVKSGYACWKNKGVIWRGTRYPLEWLRAGQRVKF